MTIFDEIQANVAGLAENAGSSVVGVGQQWGAGSGIVLGAGQVLTNAHNVRGDRLMVTFAGGHTAEGSVTGHDIDADLAVIGVDTGGAPALPWAASASAAIGMPVFTLANPGGRGLRITGSLEHTAPLLPDAHHRGAGVLRQPRDVCLDLVEDCHPRHTS